MRYYIIVNNERQGPFSYEELAVKGINADVLVWTEGMENWLPAAQVESLRDIVKSSEMPQAQRVDDCSQPTNDCRAVSDSSQQRGGNPGQKKRMRGGVKFFIGLLIFLILVAGVMFVTNPKKEKHKEVLTEIINDVTKAGLQGATNDKNAEMGSALASSMIGKLFDEFFEYHNYGLFSTCTFKGSNGRVSLGLFTKVFVFDKDEIIKKINEGKDNMNSLGKMFGDGATGERNSTVGETDDNIGVNTEAESTNDNETDENLNI